MKSEAIRRLTEEFGPPTRETKKVKAWDLRDDFGVVVQIDQPKANPGTYAYIWLPYPLDNEPIPEIALEYPGEAGRHSNTYASPGLSRGLPVLKLKVTDNSELDDTIEYIRAFRDGLPLPEVRPSAIEPTIPIPVDPSVMLPIRHVKPRREAIPRDVQREVWQRDGGRCVQCHSQEKLCFDHIVPFSKGGSNTVRNLQLLCERCNSSKGNRL